jgi:hypothetical protein
MASPETHTSDGDLGCLELITEPLIHEADLGFLTAMGPQTGLESVGVGDVN